PYAGRLRAAVEVRQRTDAIGEQHVDRLSLSEQRIDTQLAWAPWSSTFLQLVVPTVHRSIDYFDGTRRSITSLGDIELRAKIFVWQDRSLASRHLVAVLGGLKMPTAPIQKGQIQGEPGNHRLPLELQAGTGSWDPLVGVSYSWFPRPWALF